MNLHRSGSKAEWTNVPEGERNLAQKVAARTGGIVTPGNLVSMAGGLLVLSGLNDIYHGRDKRGVAKIGIGRIGDMVDGTVAEKTKTKSPTGEAVDAGIDKVLMAAAIPVLVKRDVLPKSAAGLIVAQNIASAAIAVEGKRREIGIHPSEDGKKSVAAQWGSIGLYSLAIVARKADAPKLAEGLEAAALASLAGATLTGVSAVNDYYTDLKSPYAAVHEADLPGPVSQ